MGNKNLNRAKKEKNDEFYTQLTDIEKELKHYKEQFKDKTVFCNCDDPEHSNFWKYFYLNFEHLGLKKLIATHYDAEKPTYKLECHCNNRDEAGELKVTKTTLKQNGDFRSSEAINLLESCDIVCTNPPFSLFREYISQLIKYDKQFLIIGNQNNVGYKEVFPSLKDNKIWLGYNNGAFRFRVPEYFERKNVEIGKDGKRYAKFGNICWFTNLYVNKRHEKLILYKKYNSEKHPKYDNYDAINVNKVIDIPVDYDGIMGVPITFMSKHNPEQFEILGVSGFSKKVVGIPILKEKSTKPFINNKGIYARLFIKSKCV